MRIGEVVKGNHYRVLSVFFKYAVSYFLIITIIFATVGIYSYNSALSANELKVKSEIGSLLDENISAVETNLYALANVLTSLSYDGDVAQIRRQPSPYPSSEYLELSKLEDKLWPYVSASEYLNTIVMAFFESGVIVSSDGVGVRAEEFYDLKLAPVLGGSYSHWMDMLGKNAPGQMVFIPRENAELLEMVYSPSGKDEHGGFAISMLLDPGMLSQSLGNSEYERNSILVVEDERGVPFYTSDPEKGAKMLENLQNDKSGYLVIDEVNYDFFSGASDLGFTYYLAVATDEIIAINQNIRNGFVLVYVIVLLVTVALSLVFALNMSKPITSIITAIDKSGTSPDGKRHRNDLSYINQSVSTMAERNQRLQREIESYNTATRDNFFYKLLGGDPITQREIHMVEDDVSRIFSFNSFAVALIQFFSYEDDEQKIYWEISKSMVLAADRLGPLEKEGAYLHKCGYDRLALILCSGKKLTRELLEEKMEPIIRALMDTTKMDFSCAMGDVCENCDQLYTSYQNACYVLGNTEGLRTGEISWYDGAAGKRLLFNFPVDTEQKLINAICLGNLKQAQEIVDLLFEANRASLYLSRRQLSYFVSAMTVVFLRVCGQVSDLTEEHLQQVNLYLWQMRNVTDVESVRRYVIMLTDLVVRITSSRGEQRSKSLLEKIMAYIGEHFAEDTLCLASIAKNFHLTESYVSTFFKQQTDNNISLYIEKVRMEHAKTLVRRSGLPTKEIAVLCGYQNLNTFYKAFKRNFGVSPKDFKNLEEE